MAKTKKKTPTRARARKAAPARKRGAQKRSAAKKAARKAPTKAAKKAKKVAARASTRVAAKKATPAVARRKPAARKKLADRKRTVTRRPPGLDRERRTVREDDIIPTPPSSLNMDRTASSVRSGRHELAERLRKHTSTGPALTGGDVDADWEDAETVGDEAPGGDNPTPDQDIVEEIGEALGVTYHDNEELKGGDEFVERDRHRWELDPASREDYDEE